MPPLESPVEESVLRHRLEFTLSDAPLVSTEELKARLDGGEEVVIVDVRRGSWERSDEQIAGALRVDPKRVEEDSRQIPAGSTVVAYCT